MKRKPPARSSVAALDVVKAMLDVVEAQGITSWRETWVLGAIIALEYTGDLVAADGRKARQRLYRLHSQAHQELDMALAGEMRP